MSSTFDDSVDVLVQPSADGSVIEDSLSSFHSEKEIETPLEDEYLASGGSVLPPLSEMQPEEGVALREWRRQNALRLEEKEKMEKESLNQIIDEAEDYKINFHNKRKITCDNNIAANRETEKMYLAGREKFHAEADKSYWKAIADLIPKEVAVIETRGAKKEQKPSVVAIQGPKPGKPTDLSRMRQVLVKLKHNTPLHLKHSPPPPVAAEDAMTTATPPPPPPATVVTTAEPVPVA